MLHFSLFQKPIFMLKYSIGNLCIKVKVWMVSKYLHEVHTHNRHPIYLFRKVSRPRFVLNLRLKFTCVTYDPLRSTTDQFESIGYWVTAQLGHQAHKFTSKNRLGLVHYDAFCPFFVHVYIFIKLYISCIKSLIRKSTEMFWK